MYTQVVVSRLSLDTFLMDSIVINAPAKVNLFLKVLGKRPDGYHNIETLFEKIALFDKIRLTKAASGITVSSDARLPNGRDNLAYRAAELLADRQKKPLGIKIEIEKSIPIGAGLGGGSSDAAAVLVGVNRLYNIGLSRGELERLGRELGADVPLFVSDSVWALGTERGDRLKGIETGMRLWHILIVPPFPILSGDAYERLDKYRGLASILMDDVLRAVEGNDIGFLGKNLYNDLEGIALEKLALLKELKKMLIEYGARGAAITGSGPALYGIVERKEEVMRLKKRIEMIEEVKEWQIYIAPTLSEKQGG